MSKDLQRLPVKMFVCEEIKGVGKARPVLDEKHWEQAESQWYCYYVQG